MKFQISICQIVPEQETESMHKHVKKKQRDWSKPQCRYTTRSGTETSQECESRLLYKDTNLTTFTPSLNLPIFNIRILSATRPHN